MEIVNRVFSWVRRCVSPVYMAMLFAAFVLWFITKLGDTYTTDHEVTVTIDNVEYNVSCTIRGKGTDLVHYTLSTKRSNFVIPSSDLTHDKPIVDNEGRSYVHITAESLKLALAQRMGSVDVVAVGSVPIILQDDVAQNNTEADTVTL
ncbi:MAG: hypothetical protein J6V26_03695 [Alistipes sp.]|nr:hypothetical protein [Alistipes sp.]